MRPEPTVQLAPTLLRATVSSDVAPVLGPPPVGSHWLVVNVPRPVVIGGPGNPCASIDASGYDGIIDNYVSVTGATSLLAVALNSVGASWTVGNGRTVFLGPMFLEDYATYANEDLLDGTQAASIELFLRAIEWAAKAR